MNFPWLSTCPLALDEILQWLVLSLEAVAPADATDTCKPHEAPLTLWGGGVRTIGPPSMKAVTATINQEAFFHEDPQGKGQISSYRTSPDHPQRAKSGL